MSPEQRTADSLTPATDQYSLGVMAFELLTGRLPFTGTPGEMLRAHLNEPPPSIRELRPDVSPAVEALVHRMLAKQAADRYPSLAEPERMFSKLVADAGQTTLQLAAYSRIRERAGSQVIAAVARPAPEVRRSAPTVRTGVRPSAPTVRTSDAMAHESVASVAPTPSRARGRSGTGRTLAGAAAGLALLAIAFVLTRGGSDADTPTVESISQSPPATVAADGETQPAAPSATPLGGQAAADPGTSASSADRAAAGSQNRGVSIQPAPLLASNPDSAETWVPPPVPATVPPPAPSAARPPPESAEPSAPALPAASLADARRIGREFVTLLNQRRYRRLGDRFQPERVAFQYADCAVGWRGGRHCRDRDPVSRPIGVWSLEHRPFRCSGVRGGSHHDSFRGPGERRRRWR